MLSSKTIKPIAQAGLAAKGVVYCLLGLLVFMAAFHINGQSASDTDKAGVLDFISEQSGGKIVLGVIAAGLVCYCIWRFLQGFGDAANKGNDGKGIAVRARYLFSGLVYGFFALQAAKMSLSNGGGSGSSNQNMAAEILSKPFGQWLLGITAAILLSVGIYQIYYGLSEKYRKHAEKVGHSRNAKLMLTAGKIGYVARGLVWLLISWLLLKAALHANSSEAGDTSKAFSFLENAAYGTFLLAAMGVGLICYGTFNFIRARYENFG